jgi:nucleoside-diphosphate-sugar epimerase
MTTHSQTPAYTWSSKRVLVSGATGFIGSEVTKRLIELNSQVSVITRTKPASLTVNWISAGDSDAFPSQEIADFNPEVVIHLATRFQSSHSPADIKGLVQSNIEFGTNLLESAKKAGAVFVNINSAWQHFESQQYSPVSLYAATKQAFADIAQYYGETGLDLRNLTLYDTYGPTDKRNKLVRQLLNAASDNERLDMGRGDQLINLLFVSDVVAAILGIAELRPTPRIQNYVVRAENSISIRELVTEIEKVTKNKLNVNWGARQTRPREMTSDWVFGELLPGWQQHVKLGAGLSTCWQEHISET